MWTSSSLFPIFVYPVKRYPLPSTLFALAEKVTRTKVKKANELLNELLFPGANQSIAFAKAGGHVFHAGNFGHDAVWIKDYMAENGIDMKYARVKENEVRIYARFSNNSLMIVFSEMVELSFKSVGRQEITVLYYIPVQTVHTQPKKLQKFWNLLALVIGLFNKMK